MTKKDIENKETMIWEEISGPLEEFHYIGIRLGYKYFVGAFFQVGEVEVAALCRDRDELTETFLMFSERGYYCRVDAIDATDLYDFELN